MNAYGECSYEASKTFLFQTNSTLLKYTEICAYVLYQKHWLKYVSSMYYIKSTD